MASAACFQSQDFQICVLSCEKTSCHCETVTRFEGICRNHGFKHVHVRGVIRIHKIKTHTQKCHAAAAFVCKHNEKKWNDLSLELNALHKIYFASIGSVESDAFQKWYGNVDGPERMNRFFDIIRVSLGNFEACENEYETLTYQFTQSLENSYELPGSKFQPLRPVEVGTSSTNNADDYSKASSSLDVVSDDTSACYRRKREKDAGTTERQSSTDTIVRRSFIHTKKLRSSQTNHGPFVFSDYVMPTQNFKDIFSDNYTELVQAFNKHSETNSGDMERYIVKDAIPECIECKNVHALVILLKCDKRRVQKQVLQGIESILYSTEIRCCNTLEILNGLRELAEMFYLWSGNKDCLLDLLHVTSLLLTLLFMVNLNRNAESQLMTEVSQVCSCVMSNVKNVQRFHEKDDMMKCVLEYIQKMSFEAISHCGNYGSLRLGCWSDAMRNEDNRLKIEKDFPSLCELEKCTCFFGILNQIMRKPNEDHGVLFELLKAILSSYTQKKKYTVGLLLITKILVKILKNSKEQAGKGIEILCVFLNNNKIPQTLRQKLIHEIEGLIFHEDKTIVASIIDLLEKYKYSPKDFRQIEISHIESILQPLDITVKFESLAVLNYDQTCPIWQTYDVTVATNNDSLLHVLHPSKKCLKDGVMEDYRTRTKNKYLLQDHENQRDILYILSMAEENRYVLPLIAYQSRPLPIFYITPKFTKSHSLCEYLRRKRKERKWRSLSHLTKMIQDIFNAVKFLHSKNLIHRDLTASSFSVSSDGTVLLSKFTIAKRIPENTKYISECLKMPLRWSPRESILDDEFDERSDTYMIGMTMCEIYTHGCQPYTELYKIPLEHVLELVLFQNLKPRQWPCIPRDIHSIILGFVETLPQRRLHLDEGLNRLMKYQKTISTTRILPSDVHKQDMKYPEIDNNLPKEPERSTDSTFMISASSALYSPNDRDKIYANMVHRVPLDKVAVSEADLRTSDSPIVKSENQNFVVTEKMRRAFYENTFPHLSTSNLMDIFNISNSKWPPDIERKGDEHFLVFECFKGEELASLSMRRPYGNPNEQMAGIKYLQIVHGLISLVHELHEKDWLLGDVCCQNLYYDDSNGKVFPVRLGRMIYIKMEDSLDDSVLDEIFPDRQNWSPVEVIQHGQYSKESDVYMTSMTIFQFYMGLQIRQEDPLSTWIGCIPFCNVPKDKLLDHLFSGEFPSQPEFCPEELYSKMKECWNRDRTRRPCLKELLTLTSRLIEQSRVSSSSSTDYPNSSDEYPQSTSLEEFEQSLRTKPTKRKSFNRNEESRKPLHRSDYVNLPLQFSQSELTYSHSVEIPDKDGRPEKHRKLKGHKCNRKRQKSPQYRKSIQSSENDCCESEIRMVKYKGRKRLPSQSGDFEKMKQRCDKQTQQNNHLPSSLDKGCQCSISTVIYSQEQEITLPPNRIPDNCTDPYTGPIYIMNEEQTLHTDSDLSIVNPSTSEYSDIDRKKCANARQNVKRRNTRCNVQEKTSSREQLPIKENPSQKSHTLDTNVIKLPDRSEMPMESAKSTNGNKKQQNKRYSSFISRNEKGTNFSMIDLPPIRSKSLPCLNELLPQSKSEKYFDRNSARSLPTFPQIVHFKNEQNNLDQVCAYDRKREQRKHDSKGTFQNMDLSLEKENTFRFYSDEYQDAISMPVPIALLDTLNKCILGDNDNNEVQSSDKESDCSFANSSDDESHYP